MLDDARPVALHQSAVVFVAAGDVGADEHGRLNAAFGQQRGGLYGKRLDNGRAEQCGQRAAFGRAAGQFERRVVAPTEYQAAQADIGRVIDAFDEIDAQTNPSAHGEARTALAAIETAVRERAAAADLRALIDRARSAITTLSE